MQVYKGSITLVSFPGPSVMQVYKGKRIWVGAGNKGNDEPTVGALGQQESLKLLDLSLFLLHLHPQGFHLLCMCSGVSYVLVVVWCAGGTHSTGLTWEVR